MAKKKGELDFEVSALPPGQPVALLSVWTVRPRSNRFRGVAREKEQGTGRSLLFADRLERYGATMFSPPSGVQTPRKTR
jgi:hypothetical protein